MSILGPKFDEALAFARDTHTTQVRKGTEIPYVAHLLGVCSLVLEDGGDEDEAIAALLHDAVEDQGGTAMLETVRGRFGDHVAMIVRACSDSDGDEKPPWRVRKDAYIEHLETAEPPVLRVSLADKLHNSRAIVFDVRAHGNGVWGRFKAQPDEVVWYYDALSEVFTRRRPGPMASELRRTVEQMRGLVPV
jgi:(p)ppGpp synthase/HD superfamily hydrolase